MSFKLEQLRELTQITTREDPALGIMRWGELNTFPQTLVNLIEQSANAKPAVSRTAKFYKGAGFNGEDEIVNPFGMTLKQIVAKMAEDYAHFEAFAIQCNYNIKGQVVSIYPLPITDLRFNRFDEMYYASQVGYHPNFGLNDVVKKTVRNTVTKGKIKWFDRFNPDVVFEQIEATEGGLSNYNGQILYYSSSGHSAYPIPPLQAPVNYLLADVENSILMRKETSTGFISSYILKTTLDADDPKLVAFETVLAEAQGARGTGKVITMSNLTPEDVSSTLLEEIGSGAAGAQGIVDAVQAGFELCQKVINGVYLIPPILAGADQATGFSAPDLEDAYTVFNSITADGRNMIEAELNRILKYSIFKTKEIEIIPLSLDKVEQEGMKNVPTEEARPTETPQEDA